MRALLIVSLLGVLANEWASAEVEPRMSNERVVFQLEYGDIEFGFYPDVAPITAAHIFKLCTMGAYTGNHFFRVDKGFVAQTADVMSGRDLPLNDEQREEGQKKVPLEVKKGVKHHAGTLSLARGDAPDENDGASFSMLLGDAPHLDMEYTVFGKVTKGMDVLHKLEALETKQEGIFVMPLKRVTILSTYWYRINSTLKLDGGRDGGGSGGECEAELAELKLRFEGQADELQRVRKKCLPGA